MTNWKEAPHLFANGKFKLRDQFGKIHIFNANEHCYQDIPNYTLIARPIKDLSDEESRIYESLQIDINCQPQSENDRLMEDTPESFLYLLSIGVLPEAQFSTKDVIWRHENG